MRGIDEYVQNAPGNPGETAYDAYRTYAHHASLISGAALPPWHELSSRIREAWNAAARAAGAEALRTRDVEDIGREANCTTCRRRIVVVSGH